MLSINIPVYNIEVSDLARELSDQANALAIDFEIRIYDDGSVDSVKHINNGIRSLSNVLYIEMEKNIGRAAVRNRMGYQRDYLKIWPLAADLQSRYRALLDAEDAVRKDLWASADWRKLTIADGRLTTDGSEIRKS